MPFLLGCYIKEKIMVEVCQSTNGILGLMKSAKDHPVYDFVARGLPVSLNTDNAVMFKLVFCSFLFSSHTLPVIASVHKTDKARL
jgi:adenosine deaminase